MIFCYCFDDLKDRRQQSPPLASGQHQCSKWQGQRECRGACSVLYHSHANAPLKQPSTLQSPSDSLATLRLYLFKYILLSLSIAMLRTEQWGERMSRCGTRRLILLELTWEYLHSFSFYVILLNHNSLPSKATL